MPDLNPEQLARQQIDGQLVDCGWLVQDNKSVDFSAGRGIALREVPLKTGPCDYLLLVDRKALGVIEAKKEGTTLSNVADQSGRYASSLPPLLSGGLMGPIPFLYESTGVETYFRDSRDPHPRSRRVFAFHRPETLANWDNEPDTLRLRLEQTPVAHPLSEGPGLFHCTRVPWPLRQQSPNFRDPSDGWDEFLSPTNTFAHTADEGNAAFAHHSCFFGNFKKLDDYTAVATSIIHHFPIGTVPAYYPHRDAIIDRGQWALGLYRLSRRIPTAIAVDGRGTGSYKRWGLEAETAIDYFQGRVPPNGAITSIENHFATQREHAPEQGPPPEFIYAALRTDLCVATAAAIEFFLREIQEGRHRPRRSALWPKSLITSDTSSHSPDQKSQLKIPSAPEATVVCEASWPPDEGWHFRPNYYAFAGKSAKLSKRLHGLLERFASARMPILASLLQSERSADRGSL